MHMYVWTYMWVCGVSTCVYMLDMILWAHRKIGEDTHQIINEKVIVGEKSKQKTENCV